MVESGEPSWLVIDGYEDEPAAFGVPPYVGFHVRYICGVLEEAGISYEYQTIDQYRIEGASLENRLGIVVLAGAIVPGKYLRGTPISLKETRSIISGVSGETPILCGGWAIRGWRQQGWNPLRMNLFLAVQDTDATLSHYLRNKEWKHQRRNSDEWTRWAHAGARSKAVRNNPDLNGPLTYEVEVYQGCVRYKRGCKFCIEPKKGVPIWRSPEDIIAEVGIAHDMGVEHVRLGGMTDTYTYMAEGVVEMEYPRPNPEPIANLLHGLREDERLGILHTDNANPSIIAEHLEESEEITRTLIETLSDGAVLSFGLESADPDVHEANWLNCNSTQLKSAISLINKYGRVRGERGLPKLLPGLNFIAGLNGETAQTYNLNRELLRELKEEGHMIRRVNIRQVEGEGFQEINEKEFHSFKKTVREEFDGPLLEEMLPTGTILRDVWWESHEGRTRLPRHLEAAARDTKIHGKAGITFGRQIGAYPILIGMNYLAPLESTSNILVTGHGARSITGVECGLKMNQITEKQLAAIPGIGAKSAWNLVGERAKAISKGRGFENRDEWFNSIGAQLPELAKQVIDNP